MARGLDNKIGQKIEKSPKIKRGQKFILQKDQVISDPSSAVHDGQLNAYPKKSNMPDLKKLDISPEGNTRFRSLYASANVPQKGAMSYFVTNQTIGNIFTDNETIFGDVGETAQSSFAKFTSRKRACKK